MLPNSTRVLEKFFEEYGFVKSAQIKPFNDFLYNVGQLLNHPWLREFTIKDKNNVELRLSFTNIVIDEHPKNEHGQPIYPHDVLGFSNCDYTVPVWITCTASCEEYTHSFSFKIVDLFVMVGSAACTSKGKNIPLWWEGGYFIVNGAARVIMQQEILCFNKLLRFNENDRWSVYVRSKKGFMRDITLQVDPKTDVVYMKHSAFTSTEQIPVTVLLLAVKCRDSRPFLASSYDFCGEMTQEECVEYLAGRLEATKGVPRNRRLELFKEFMSSTLVPHCESGIPEAMRYILYMVSELEACMDGKRTPDDRDHLENKRYETTGKLVSDMISGEIRAAIQKGINAVTNRISHQEQDCKTVTFAIETCFQNVSQTKHLKRCMATGDWQFPFSKSKRSDVTEEMQLENSMASVSHMRKSTSSAGKCSKSNEMRHLHGSHFGFICPSETPEGEKTGIAKNLACAALHSSKVHIDWDEFCSMCQQFPGNDYALLNGRVCKHTVDGAYLRRILLSRRRQGLIAFDVGISYEEERCELSIRSDEGRLLQALVVVENGIPRWSDDQLGNWQDWLENGRVECLDVQEVWVHAVIAVEISKITGDSTHAMLSGSAFLGLLAATVPLSNRNQSVRLSYWLAMGKQVAPPRPLTGKLWSTISYELQTPQKPMLFTHTSVLCGLDDAPCGSNMVVAIMTNPYAQEDSLVFSKSAVDRGILRVTSYHTYHVTIKPYEKLVAREGTDKDGIIEVGTRVLGKETLLVSKEIANNGTDTSVFCKSNEAGVVDGVMVRDQYIAIRIRVNRIPEVGNKYCTINGQKGTCGRICDSDDMPFILTGCMQGVNPDVIINPHAFPSRMTMEYFIEMVAGKLGAMQGKRFDGTPYGPQDSEWNKIHAHSLLESSKWNGKAHEMSEHEGEGFEEMEVVREGEEKGWSVIDAYDLVSRLKGEGFEEMGTERLADGITGEMIECPVTIGIVFMQVLRQISESKAYARGLGPVDPITRQPIHGRNNDGGMRFGEMEKDSLVAHGAAEILRERTAVFQSPAIANVCPSCGVLCTIDVTPECPQCGYEGVDDENTKRRLEDFSATIHCPKCQTAMRTYLQPRCKLCKCDAVAAETKRPFLVAMSEMQAAYAKVSFTTT